ncbi:MAG: glutaredoxin family protein [Betaproteobacteria bacterium]|nr:glutaredoxin family protein [Betaproteobacteria bacterium]
MQRGLAVIAALFLSVAVAHAQQLYRWVDKDGRVTYSQNPPPAGAAKNVQPRSLGSGSTVESSSLPYSAQVAARNFPVTLYASPDCGAPCDDARASLQKRGIPIKEVSVADPKGFDTLKSLSGGKTQVPVLQIGSRTLFGFDAAAWKNNLDEVGYPSSIFAPAQGAPTAAKAAPRGGLPLVRLFTHSQCGQPCEDARGFLNGRAVPFQEVSAESPAGLAEVRRLSEAATVPLLVIGTTVLDSFDADRYESAITTAGYLRLGGFRR